MKGRRTMVPARELRFCFVIDDYEAAAHLYRDVFGLEVLMELDEQGGRGVILSVPEATLELVNAEHGGMVDDVEVGSRVDDRVRIAVKVDDLEAASRAVTGSGGGGRPWLPRSTRPGETRTSGSGPRTACSSRCSSRPNK
jgi:catechol 2,3-dioxygenase-like lactoylglutathione lyase family enzyme